MSGELSSRDGVPIAASREPPPPPPSQQIRKPTPRSSRPPAFPSAPVGCSAQPHSGDGLVPRTAARMQLIPAPSVPRTLVLRRRCHRSLGPRRRSCSRRNSGSSPSAS